MADIVRAANTSMFSVGKQSRVYMYSDDTESLHSFAAQKHMCNVSSGGGGGGGIGG